MIFVITVEGDFINTMKTTFYLSLWLLTSFFRVKSLQVSKRSFSIDSFCSLLCLYVSMLLNSFIWIKSYIETRLHCIDYIWKLVYIVLIIYGNSSTLYWLYMFLFFEILVWKLPHYNDYLCICCRINVENKIFWKSSLSFY